MIDYARVYHAIIELEHVGPTAAAKARVLVGMVDGMRDSVDSWSLTAALTDCTPDGLVAYRAAVEALDGVGVRLFEGRWQSPWAMF